MDRTADVETSFPEVNAAASSGSANRDVAAMPEAWPQISLVGLLAWVLPPLALIGMLIVHST